MEEQPLTSQRAIIRRRRIVAVTIAVLVVAAAGSVAGWGVTRKTGTEAAPATTAPPPPPKPFHIVFPEGFTREDMADRVVAVAEIARRKRNANVRLNRTAYRAASARGIVPCFGRKAQTKLEGFLFPGDVRVPEGHDVAAARRRSDRGVLRQLAQARPRATRARRT